MQIDGEGENTDSWHSLQHFLDLSASNS